MRNNTVLQNNSGYYRMRVFLFHGASKHVTFQILLGVNSMFLFQS